jgi:hypothetical protein
LEAAETDKDELIESPAETEPVVVTHRTAPPLLRILAWIIGVAIIAFLIVLLARWIYHKSHHAVQPAPAVTKKLPASSNSSNKTPARPQTSTPAPSSPSPSNSAPPNSNLPNSGPGQTAAIFASTSLAAAGIHYIVASRRSRSRA